MDATVSFWKRVGLAWQLMFDAQLAERLLVEPTPRLPEPESPPPVEDAEPSLGPALRLLGLLQREGRLVDFLQQEIRDFPDVEIGAAARVVHEGCRKALLAHAQIEPVRTEKEGASITLPSDFDRAEVKLTGAVAGQAPYRGVLRHRGWRVRHFALPTLLEGSAPEVLAQAEVEL